MSGGDRGGKGMSPEDMILMEEKVRRRKRAPAAKGAGMGAIFNIFPLILIPVLIYNANALIGTAVAIDGAQSVRDSLASVAFAVPMASRVQWVVSYGDLLVLFALILLFIELLKSTSTGTSAIFNHALSMMVFIICLVEFLLHPAFATTPFFLMLVMSLLDVLAGVIVTIVSARRDVGFGGGDH